MHRIVIFLIVIMLSFKLFSQNNSSLIYKEFVKDTTDFGESILIKETLWKNLKFVSIGNPDYSLRYFWAYKVFEKKGDTLMQINNSSIFNEKVLELEKLVNTEFKKQYESDLKVEAYEFCMSQIKFRYYSLNEMGVFLNKKGEWEFTIYHDIMSACKPVSLNLISLDYNEVKEFLKSNPTTP